MFTIPAFGKKICFTKNSPKLIENRFESKQLCISFRHTYLVEIKKGGAERKGEKE
jgi:hypothetical protein